MQHQLASDYASAYQSACQRDCGQPCHGVCVHYLTLTSSGAILRRLTLHAVSIATRVGTNPSATHPIIVNASIADVLPAG